MIKIIRAEKPTVLNAELQQAILILLQKNEELEQRLSALEPEPVNEITDDNSSTSDSGGGVHDEYE